MNKFFLLFSLAGIYFSTLSAQTKVTASVNWNSPKGTISAMHWGYNDYAAKTQYTFDKPFTDFGNKVNPGIVRIHQAGLIREWTNATKQCWDTLKIKTCLSNATKGYPNAKVVLCFSDWPAFISAQEGTVPLDKEQALEDYFAQLPSIIKKIGQRIDYYEFLNENDESYSKGIGIDKYALLIKRLSIRFKAEIAKLALDYQPKVGGGAIRWPNSAWYEPIINLAGKDMDFFSWHHYAVGPVASGVSEEQRNNDLFANIDWMAKSAISGIRSYAQGKGCGHLQFFLDESSVQYVWTPYEPRTHNNVGAVWFASFIKRLAENKIDGAMMWNGKDGAYGLLRGDNSVSAPGSLYIWSNNYLRGDMMATTSSVSNVELMAIKSTNGKHNILVINRSANSYELSGIKNLIGLTASENVKALCIDGSIKNGDNWIPKSLDVSSDAASVSPWSLILLTNQSEIEIVPIQKLSVAAALHNTIKIAWQNQNKSINGFNILVNDKKVAFTTDTCYFIPNLSPATAYKIGVSVVDEVWNARDTTSINATTISAPLRVNNQTTGAENNQWNYSGNWKNASIPSNLNKDAAEATEAGSTAGIQFTGNKISLFGNRLSGNTQVKVLIDNVEKGQIDATSLSTDYGLLWLSEDLAEGSHQLKLEITTSGKITLDYAGIYSSLFANDHTTPGKVNAVTQKATFKSMSLSWEAPVDNAGIQCYYIQVDNNPADTVFSPNINIQDLLPNTTYSISITAFDVNNNHSEVSLFHFKTPELIYVPVNATVSAPIIDGVKDELWNIVATHPLLPLNTATSANKASLSLIWDKNYLYLFLNVEEQNPSNPGSIDVFYDGQNTKAGTYGTDDYWFTFNKTTGITSEAYHKGTANAKFKTTENGYHFEAAFKWSVIKTVNVAPLYSFGFDVHLNAGEPNSPEYSMLSFQPFSIHAGTNTNELANLQLVSENGTAAAKSLKNNGMLIFPNPASEKIVTNISELLIQDVFVLSVTGVKHCVNYKKLSYNQLEVNVSQLPSGVYTLVIGTKNQNYSQKFIIK